MTHSAMHDLTMSFCNSNAYIMTYARISQLELFDHTIRLNSSDNNDIENKTECSVLIPSISQL